MRKHIFAAALIVATSVSLPAYAQYTGTVGGPAVGIIADEEVPTFRRYVVEERLPSFAIPDRVVVGATLPDAGVVYYDVPERYGATTYRYTVVNDHTVLVDPRSRRIMQVID
ncbi:DUF1236 domain-containing protein [Bradyrhizobium sp. LHD-71]|uniref:DUF1236 domain-containing protein n=1 Tax=Bradyrhizobium sp. LHD-71 TaxID=3072141 RepID=UPI00280D0C3C|nr:DUF1236 domain-containing protein [Bradyrhizobium sp. LHD-71]MDQ8730800.1 DUF1236 domain-containing protein [Bradyrhizobium sp. LHD-71]